MINRKMTNKASANVNCHNIEFTTTATCRPEILCQTYDSFSKKMIGIDFKKCTLYINVDHTPKESSVKETIKIAKGFFGTVVENVSEQGNFCKALKWCWSQPKGTIFFHLEDDWVLKEKLNVSHCMSILVNRRLELKRKHKELIAMNLRCYQTIKDNRICLSPCFMYSYYSKHLASLLDERYNPEKQLRAKSKENPHGGKSANRFISIHYPSLRHKTIIKDIGREWMQRNDIRRNSDAAFMFNGWHVKNKG